jgi:stage III sporulation protein AG
MDNNQGPLKGWKKWLNIKEKPDIKAGKYQYLLIVLCIGATLMLAGNILFKNNVTDSAIPAATNEKTENADVQAFGFNKNPDTSSIAKYENTSEKRLKNAIEEILGVDDVTVVVNIDSTDKQILEKNKVTKSQTTKETDKDGGERKVQEISSDEQTVIIRDGEKEVPIVVETKKPEIRGVIVVAKGAENIHVVKLIKEAVTRALGVPSHRVGVYPKK